MVLLKIINQHQLEDLLVMIQSKCYKQGDNIKNTSCLVITAFIVERKRINLFRSFDSYLFPPFPSYRFYADIVIHVII